mgnify:CR=1 FL=1
MNHGNNLLLALGEDLGAGRWSVRVQVRPLVSDLVWLAALIMAIGAAIAASDRHRTARAAVTGATAVSGRAG